MSGQVPLPAQQGQPVHGQGDSTGVYQTLETVRTVTALESYISSVAFHAFPKLLLPCRKESQQAPGV